MENDLKIIKLKNVKVAFANLEDDNPMGKSIMVIVDDPVVESKIKTWVSQNKIGKSNENPGVVNFNEYDGQKRFKFKFTDRTKVVDMTGKDALEGLDRGAVISLVAKTYEYHHKQFGSGVSQSLKTVVVMKPATNEESAMTTEYLDELKEESLQDKDEDEGKNEPETTPDDDLDEIDMSDIPF